MENTLEHYPANYLDLIYKAARNCYGCRDACGTDAKKRKLVKYLINHRHESVLEHICISIYSKDVSRSFLTQLTRHRLVSYSVKSQHYVKHSNFKYKDLEDWGKEVPESNRISYHSLMKKIADLYDYFIQNGIPHYIAREILPNACYTDMFITTNAREWRYIIRLRITKNNTPEIQYWAQFILTILYNAMPELFEDLAMEYLDIDGVEH